MKIIDLLNKIANGEEVPKKIKVNSEYYEYNERTNKYYNPSGAYDLLNTLYYGSDLNTEIIIIEEDLSLGDIINNIGEALEYLDKEWEKLKDEIHSTK